MNEADKRNASDGTTDFGYRRVEREEKAEKVAEVFHSVASRYDVMNDVMSAGVHRLWKRFLLEKSGVQSGQTVLDLATGSGDIAKKLSPIVGDSGLIVASDINASMLAVGRDRLIDAGCTNIHYALINAEQLPFADQVFDCVTISFGLRNVTDKQQALNEMCRVLKPGGRLLVLEFSKPKNSLLNKVYHAYSFNIIPKLGKLITHDEDSYQYLVESIQMHPDQETLKTMMETAGFVRCDYHNLTGGVVALHVGYKCND